MRAAVLLAATLVAGAAGGQEAPDDLEALWMRACSLCHGAAGEGLTPDHPSYSSFARPPADLTDPLFNSREPGADWFLVTKWGGEKLGLSSQMPAYDGALTDDQIHALVAYMKGLADTRGYPPGDLNFPRPIRTIKAFPEDEALLITRYEDRDPAHRWRHTAYYARRFGRAMQGEVKLSTLDPGGGAASEEELELGFKWAFHDDLESALLLATGLEVEVPLDEGDEVWIPYLSLAKGIGESGFFQTTLRSHLPAAGDDDGDAELSAILQVASGRWPRSPVPGLEGTVVVPFDGRESVAWSVIPQALFGLTRGGHVAANVGVELPLGGHAWDYRVHAFLLWDIADGPFWRGW